MKRKENCMPNEITRVDTFIERTIQNTIRCYNFKNLLPSNLLYKSLCDFLPVVSFRKYKVVFKNAFSNRDSTFCSSLYVQLSFLSLSCALQSKIQSLNLVSIQLLHSGKQPPRLVLGQVLQILGQVLRQVLTQVLRQVRTGFFHFCSTSNIVGT